MKFGDYIKEHRIHAEMTLRSFSKQIGMDPSNWSKIERNIISPPQDEQLMQRISELLKLDSKANQELLDLADIARGQIPVDLLDNELMAKMPAFFRTMRDQEYTEGDLEKLKQGVRDLHSK